jgi:hypothetical protein
MPNPPLPVGAEPDIWQQDDHPYRVLYGASRGIAGRDDVIVGTTAIQFSDGRINDRRVHEDPHVYVETNSDKGLSSEQARELAALLIEAADEVDRWSAR